MYGVVFDWAFVFRISWINGLQIDGSCGFTILRLHDTYTVFIFCCYIEYSHVYVCVSVLY